MKERKNKFVVIIPARYASSRFPGKPLARIGGVEMIVRVCRKASMACPEVMVATDDERIARCVEDAGFRAVMTDPNHKSGTDRIREAYLKSGSHAEVIINIQGDEPFIDPSQIEQLMDCFDRSATRIATLGRPFDPALGLDALEDPNLVKLTFGLDSKALYFSRSVIPYVRTAPRDKWLETTTFHSHVGVYAYRRETLLEITALPESPLESLEKLEQLRWLQNGYDVTVAITTLPTIGIDTPQDLEFAEKYLHTIENTRKS